MVLRTTTADAAIPVIASYLLGSSLLNLHRGACCCCCYYCQFRWIYRGKQKKEKKQVSVRDPQGLRPLINHRPPEPFGRIFLLEPEPEGLHNSERLECQPARHKNNNFLSCFLPSRLEVNSLIFVWVLRPVVCNGYSLAHSACIFLVLFWLFHSLDKKKGKHSLLLAVSVTHVHDPFPISLCSRSSPPPVTSCHPPHENLRRNLSHTER